MLFRILTCISLLKKLQVSYIAQKYKKANNEYMASYDKGKSSKHIIHVETNNSYGWAMTQWLQVDLYD